MVETLPAVMAEISKLLPELRGRSYAVTEAEITKDNVPTLPAAMAAPIRQDFEHNGNSQRMNVVEEFMIEFWLEPARIKTETTETPFWSYYEYNAFRNKLFTFFSQWRTPQNGSITFVSMDVEANYLATVLSFRMRATYDLCPTDEELSACIPDLDSDGKPVSVTFNICKPKSERCAPPEEEEEEKPCPE